MQPIRRAFRGRWDRRSRGGPRQIGAPAQVVLVGAGGDVVQRGGLAARVLVDPRSSLLPALPARPITPAMTGAETLVPIASQKDLPQGSPTAATWTISPGSATAARSAIARLPWQPTAAARFVCHTAAAS